jgi:flagellar biosynthesis/type III secretory pathway M-ring protein FliF/YscJ
MNNLLEFFTKMGDKNPELCLVIVFALILNGTFLFFVWKVLEAMKVLFSDYKTTLKESNQIIENDCEVIGAFTEVARQCYKQQKGMA